MALTGLDIYKLLPKKNCKECGVPTCLAFAMKLAAKQASLSQCRYISPEAAAQLEAAAQPPIRLVEIGTGERKVTIGQETVLFRHEESFYHPAGLAVLLEDTDDVASRAKKIHDLLFERVGTKLAVDLFAVRNSSGNPDKFQAAVKACQDAAPLPLVLISENSEAMKKALSVCGANRPLIHAATANNYQQFAGLAKEYSCPLVVKAENLDALSDLTSKIKALGVEDMLLDVGTENPSEAISLMTQIRRASLKKNYRPLGYMPFAFAIDKDPRQAALNAATYILKYAGVVVTNVDTPALLFPILTTRQNIYTDPRKPISVDAKIYEVRNPDENSPVLVTTNFSLTYYSVENEVESSRVPAYIIAVDTEGTSVLTAWAADKFNATTISNALKNFGIEQKVKHRKLIIPGYVPMLSAGIEDKSGWKVIIGPQEASGLPTFLKNEWRAE